MSQTEAMFQLHYYNGIVMESHLDRRVGDLNMVLRTRAGDYMKLNANLIGFHREHDVQVIITHCESTRRLTLMADCGATASFEMKDYEVEAVDGPYDLQTAIRWLDWFSKRSAGL